MEIFTYDEPRLIRYEITDSTTQKAGTIYDLANSSALSPQELKRIKTKSELLIRHFRVKGGYHRRV